MSAPPNDKPAAFRGLIITALLLFVVCFAIVKLTTASFTGREGEAKAASH